MLFLKGNSLFGGGFQVNLQGVAQTGMGHCGAGLAFDASVQCFNPGGLAFAPSSATVGITPIFARISYLAPSPDNYTTTNEKTISPPFNAYGSYRLRLNDKHSIAIGAAVYTPFGSRVRYADDWKGQFALREISLKTIFIQPTIGTSSVTSSGLGAALFSQREMCFCAGVCRYNSWTEVMARHD